MRRQPNLSCCVVAFGALVAWGAGPLRAQPANDLFANRTFISGTNLLVTGSNIGATGEVGEPMHAGVDGGKSVWWSWTAPFSGRTTVTSAGSDFDTLLGVYTGSSVAGLTEIASNDDSVGVTSRANFFALGGQTYQIAVDGFEGDSGGVRLGVQLVPGQQATNDMFASRTIVTGTNAVAFGNNNGSTSEAGEPDHFVVGAEVIQEAGDQYFVEGGFAFKEPHEQRQEHQRKPNPGNFSRE